MSFNGYKTLKEYELNGVSYTLQQLSDMHGIPITTINNRIRNGWPIERAISEPRPESKKKKVPPEFENGGVVEVVFRTPIPSVYTNMQPIIGKKYVMRAYPTVQAEPIFSIQLENGLPLIVYPGEFEIVNVYHTQELAIPVCG